MKIVRELWLCDDCTIVAVNDDPSGIDSDERVKEVYDAIAHVESTFGPLSCNDTDPGDDPDLDERSGHREFSWAGCDCCGSRLGGSLTRFAILGPDDV